MTETKSNLHVQRGRIIKALLNDLYALSPDGTPTVTAWCEGEHLGDNLGRIEDFVDHCLSVDEVTLRVKTQKASFGFVSVIWGNGTGCAISDFSESLTLALSHSLAIAEFLDV